MHTNRFAGIHHKHDFFLSANLTTDSAFRTFPCLGKSIKYTNFAFRNMNYSQQVQPFYILQFIHSYLSAG